MNSLVKLSVTISVAFVLIPADFVLAQTVVFEQAPDTSIVGIGQPSLGPEGFGFNQLQWAENFSVSADASISNVQWWGINHDNGLTGALENPGLENIGAFTIQFWSIGGLTPGTLLQEETFSMGDTNLVDTGLASIVPNASNLFSQDVSLSAPFEAIAGEAYFISIFARQTDGLDEWHWQDSVEDNAPWGMEAIHFWNQTGWFGGGGFTNQSFRLSTVPEPATALLLGMGAVVTLRRKRSGVSN